MIERRSVSRRKDQKRLEEIIKSGLQLQAAMDGRKVKIGELVKHCIIPRSTLLSLVPNIETLFLYFYIEGMNKIFQLYEKSERYEASGRESLFRLYIAEMFFIKLNPTLSTFRYENLDSKFYDGSLNEVLVLAKQKRNQYKKLILKEVEKSIINQELDLPSRILPIHLLRYIDTGTLEINDIDVSVDSLDKKLANHFSSLQFVMDALNWKPISRKVDFMDTIGFIVDAFYKAEFYNVKGEADFLLLRNY